MKETLINKTKDELITIIEELMMECDERKMHSEILSEQVRQYGGEPFSFDAVTPWGIVTSPEDMEIELQ